MKIKAITFHNILYTLTNREVIQNCWIIHYLIFHTKKNVLTILDNNKILLKDISKRHQILHFSITSLKIFNVNCEHIENMICWNLKKINKNIFCGLADTFVIKKKINGNKLILSF